MKSILKALRPYLIILIGSTLALASSAINLSEPVGQVATVTATPTLASAAKNVSEAGSTNGIVIMASIIVVIVIIPIFWKRRQWLQK
jgi:membrane protein YdbS with pleckstrin-like domain